MPFALLTLKVIQCADGSYQAISSVFVMSRDVIEYTGEYAETILETVRDAIDRFCNEIEKHFSSREVEGSSFVWLA